MTSTRFACAALLALLGGCSTGPSGADVAPPTETELKRLLLLGSERAIHRILTDARGDIAAIQAEFRAAVDRAPRAFSISSSDPGLARFGDVTRSQRSSLIEDASKVQQLRLGQLVDYYTGALWTVTTDAGRRARGGELGTRTGYIDLDGKVDAALIQLSSDADKDGAAQNAEGLRHDQVALERSVREELPGIGVISLYKSPPTADLFAVDDEGRAIVVVFARKKESPLESGLVLADLRAGRKNTPSLVAGPEFTAPCSFVQAVRRRVERSGFTVESTPWKLDPAFAATRGTMAASDEVDAATHVATRLYIPAVDKSDPSFRALWNHVLVAEYRTALRRDDTGEIVATIGWQVRWNIDNRGRLRVLVDWDDQLVPDDRTVAQLLLEPAAGG